MRNDIGGARRLIISPIFPSPTVMAGGIGSVNCSQYCIDITRKEREKLTDKPPFRMPSMQEIQNVPWNGYKVVSTFSGCGGSCLGYRMAGFKVVWANEFVPAAQDSYRANMEQDCFLDCRDVKMVTPDDILQVTGLQVGELDLFDGSPPCQAFSTAGKREKGWGKDKQYEHGAKQQNETLFAEYIRLLHGLQPKTFVAENVSGLVKGTAKGYFIDILTGLKNCGYKVKAKLLDAQWLGVPQMRQRIIFVGVRNDLELEPVHPSPLPYRYSIRDALPEISKTIMLGHGWFDGSTNEGNKPQQSITSSFSDKYQVEAQNERRKFTIAELKRICSFPDDFVLTGSYNQQWERLGNSVPPTMMYYIASTIRDKVLSRIG